MARKENILTEKQIAFLQFTSAQPDIAKNYYLTGGTPLAAFYLQHRLSEDLDFFIESQEVNLLAVQKVIKLSTTAFKLTKVSYENFQGLHNFFLTYPDGEELKVDFSYYPFPRVEQGRREYGLAVDSVKDIAINKIQSVGTRTKARDFVDLYFLIQEYGYSISELMTAARNKFDFYIDPIQYGKQFFKVTEAKDYPRMIKPLDQKELESFFIKEAEKLACEILE